MSTPEPMTRTEVVALIETVENIEASARMILSRLGEQHDALALAARPTYPTPGQRLGIREAARRIAMAEEATTHHGDHCGPGLDPAAVLVDGAHGWLNVRTGAPSRHGRSEALWDFTDEDVEGILAVVRDQGLTITRHWRADRSISIQTEKAKIDG